MAKRYINIIILAIYIIFSIATFAQAKDDTYNFVEKETLDMEAVWLSGTPLIQTFTCYNFTGVRVWATNENNIDHGYLVVAVGDSDSGEVLFEERIPAHEIPLTVLEEYIEATVDPDLMKGEKHPFISLYTEGIEDKQIKTYLCGESGASVVGEGDGRVYEGKSYYFVVRRSYTSSKITLWVIVTGMLLACAVAFFNVKPVQLSRRFRLKKRPLKIRALYAGILIILVFIGMEFKSIQSDPFTSVVLDDPQLEGGYVMHEHSTFHQSFMMKYSQLDHINIYLKANFNNNAMFVASLQRGTDEVFSSVQSNELEKTSNGVTAYYVWDVSDTQLKQVGEYDVYIFTGFIEEGQQGPVISKIEYVYR